MWWGLLSAFGAKEVASWVSTPTLIIFDYWTRMNLMHSSQPLWKGFCVKRILQRPLGEHSQMAQVGPSFLATDSSLISEGWRAKLPAALMARMTVTSFPCSQLVSGNTWTVELPLRVDLCMQIVILGSVW